MPICADPKSRKTSALISVHQHHQRPIRRVCDEASPGLRCRRIHRRAPFGRLRAGLVKKLKRECYWVCGVDIKHHEFAPTQADEFLLLDLREPQNCWAALTLDDGTFDEVYQLAADMGGMGFVSIAGCEVLHNNALININMAHTAAEMGVPRCGTEEQGSGGAEEQWSRTWRKGRSSWMPVG